MTMKKGYKANRPSAAQVEINYLKGQIKTLNKMIERYNRVNQKRLDKGEDIKYTHENFEALRIQINVLEDKIYG